MGRTRGKTIALLVAVCFSLLACGYQPGTRLPVSVSLGSAAVVPSPRRQEVATASGVGAILFVGVSGISAVDSDGTGLRSLVRGGYARSIPPTGGTSCSNPEAWALSRCRAACGGCSPGTLT
jgi:hypothetical protein